MMRWWVAVGWIGWAALCVLMGWGVVIYGGVPHGFDRYGVVPIPGRQVIELPAGTVTIDHADDVEGCWDNTHHIPNASIYNLPRGTQVRVVPMNGAPRPARFERVPDWLY